MKYDLSQTGQTPGRNSFGGSAFATSATPAEPSDWQGYYARAQQLYDAGFIQQAEEYHAYAQRLYDLELQNGTVNTLLAEQAPSQTISHTPTVYQSVAPPKTAQPVAAASETPPSWESLYSYAQQLYDAGHVQQAEAYYEQAQQLFSAAGESNSNLPSAASPPVAATPSSSSWPASTASSPPPPATSSWPAATASSPPPPATSNWAASSASISPVVAGYDEEDSVLASGLFKKRKKKSPLPKKPLKHRIKVWAIATLLIGSVVCIGGFIGLFQLYQQQRQSAAAQQQNHSFASTVFRPVISALQPAFDKTIRLSQAADPLLVELHIREAKVIEQPSPLNETAAPAAAIAPVVPPPTEAVAAPDSAPAAEANEVDSAIGDAAASATPNEETAAAPDEETRDTPPATPEDSAGSAPSAMPAPPAPPAIAAPSPPAATATGANTNKTSADDATVATEAVKEKKASRSSRRKAKSQAASKTRPVATKSSRQKAKSKSKSHLNRDPLAGMSL